MTAIQKRSSTVTSGNRGNNEFFNFYLKGSGNELKPEDNKSIPDKAISFEFWRKAAISIHKQKPDAKGQNNITSVKPWLKNTAIPKKKPIDTPAQR